MLRVRVRFSLSFVVLVVRTELTFVPPNNGKDEERQRERMSEQESSKRPCSYTFV